MHMYEDHARMRFCTRHLQKGMRRFGSLNSCCTSADAPTQITATAMRQSTPSRNRHARRQDNDLLFSSRLVRFGCEGALDCSRESSSRASLPAPPSAALS